MEISLRWDQRICFPNKPPGDVNAGGLGTTLGELLLERASPFLDAKHLTNCQG